MKLKCYALNDSPPKLAAARPYRQWMDDFPDRHAYRCLPLSIANVNGWEVLCPVPIEVHWTGGLDVKDLTVKALKPMPDGRPIEHFCRSNFSRGIVTFHTDYLFMTEPGWDLIATGPLNQPKDNASPLTGLIESDWLPYPFTMNWQIMRPGRVLFEEGEPFCLVYPVPKQALADCEVEIHRLSDHAELHAQHEAFRNSRDDFMKRLQAGDAAATKQAWQRFYFTGQHPDGTKAEGHLNKLRLKEPMDCRAPLAPPPAIIAPQEDLPWEENSPLERISWDQSDANRRGRARIGLKGGLLEQVGTRHIRSAKDADGLDFLCMEDFLSRNECENLCATFEKLKEKIQKFAEGDSYWNNRFLWLEEVLKNEPDSGRLMIEKQREAASRVMDFYKIKKPIYSDLSQIVQWPVGISMPPHADNANPDGSAHMMDYRDFSGIIYLNDTYSGGELYFTALDVAIKPKAGMFIGFTAGFHHEHAVLQITGGGTRLTMPSFFTFERNRADRLIYPELMG